MPQRAKLKNTKTSSYDPVKSIIDSILLEVSKAITIRIESKRVIQKAIEDAIQIGKENKRLKERRKVEIEMATRQLRRNSQAYKYRIDPSLLSTTPISGTVYEVSLRHVDRQPIERVGYDVASINPGTTKHVYAALRSLMTDIKRNTSIRIWYKNHRDKCVTVFPGSSPAEYLIHQKVFVTKLSSTATTPTPEEDAYYYGMEIPFLAAA